MEKETQKMHIQMSENESFQFAEGVKEGKFFLKNALIGYCKEEEGSIRELRIERSGILRNVNFKLENNQEAKLGKRDFASFTDLIQNEDVMSKNVEKKNELGLKSKDQNGKQIESENKQIENNDKKINQTSKNHNPKKIGQTKSDIGLNMSEFENFFKTREASNGSIQKDGIKELDMILGIKKPEKKVTQVKKIEHFLLEIELCGHPLIYNKICTICYERVPDMKPQILGLENSEVELRGTESSKLLIGSLKKRKKLVMILDLDHTIVHSCCVTFESKIIGF